MAIKEVFYLLSFLGGEDMTHKISLVQLEANSGTVNRLEMASDFGIRIFN